MARVNQPLLAFNRGEVSKHALGRVDVAKLQLSAECQLNWEPRVIGPMGLRPGLEFIGEMLGDQAGRILPFIFSKNDTALLELTPSAVRFWVDEDLVTRPSVATTISDPNFAGGGSWDTSDTTSGATVTIAGGVCTLSCTPIGALARVKQQISVAGGDFGKEHGIRLVVSNGPVTVRAGSTDGLTDLIQQTTIDTGTHALTCTPSTDIFLQIDSTDSWAKTLSSVTIDAAGVLEIATPWGADDLPTVRQTQSGDVIFAAAYGLQQYKIERRSTHGWSFVSYRSSNGPFQTTPGITANFTPSAYYGNGTLTSDRAYFEAGHQECLFQLFSSGQFYQTVIGAANAYSPAVRVTGVGTVARNYSWTVSGTWVGTITLQRSFDGPDSGFTDVSSVTSNGTIGSSTGGSGGSPDLDNAIAWERVGFKGGNYTSGNATVISNYAGGGGFAIVRVKGYNSPTQVQIEILEPFSSLSATTDWLEQDWSGVIGYPTAVGFYEGRLVWTGRDEMWFSQSNNYEGYAVQDLQGNDLGDSGAIIETFGEGPVDSVNWLLSLTRPLFGREGSISSARSSSFDEPMTPTNFSVKDCSTQGAARLPALKIDKDGIFVQQSGRRVYELSWRSFNAEGLDYAAHDLTRLNLDIGKPGFNDLAVARQPDTACYFPRKDGICAALLYDPDDDVVAWWRIATLGTIENVCVLPSATGYEDLVYFVVKRTINGTPRRFIERLALRDNCTGGLINQLLDSHVVYQGAPASTITLAHLPNTSVQIWADGKSLGAVTTNGSGIATLPGAATASNIVAGLSGSVVSYANDTPVSAMPGLSAYEGLTAEVFADQQPSGRMVRLGSFVVSGGTIALPENLTSSSIVACFGYVAPFMSAKLAYAAQMGSPLTQKKKIDHLGLVLFDTHAQGLQSGQRFDKLDELPLEEDGGDVGANAVWSEYDQPVISAPGEWNTDGRLCLLAQAPYPAYVSAAVIAMVTNEK
jgi:hypothetical protein